MFENESECINMKIKNVTSLIPQTGITVIKYIEVTNIAVYQSFRLIAIGKLRLLKIEYYIKILIDWSVYNGTAICIEL